MDKSLEQQVRAQAEGACEYCRLPEKFSKLKFPIDHVIANQHGRNDALENLALACGFCNRHKGPNIAGVDPATGRIVQLFHPRQDNWAEHFRWEGAGILGLTPVGRATIVVLAMNHALQVATREALINEGLM